MFLCSISPICCRILSTTSVGFTYTVTWREIIPHCIIGAQDVLLLLTVDWISKLSSNAVFTARCRFSATAATWLSPCTTRHDGKENCTCLSKIQGGQFNHVFGGNYVEIGNLRGDSSGTTCTRRGGIFLSILPHYLCLIQLAKRSNVSYKRSDQAIGNSLNSSGVCWILFRWNFSQI